MEGKLKCFTSVTSLSWIGTSKIAAEISTAASFCFFRDIWAKSIRYESFQGTKYLLPEVFNSLRNFGTVASESNEHFNFLRLVPHSRRTGRRVEADRDSNGRSQRWECLRKLHSLIWQVVLDLLGNAHLDSVGEVSRTADLLFQLVWN